MLMVLPLQMAGLASVPSWNFSTTVSFTVTVPSRDLLLAEQPVLLVAEMV